MLLLLLLLLLLLGMPLFVVIRRATMGVLVFATGLAAQKLAGVVVALQP